jgi:DNA-binding transcriptional ArsR family regulator
MATREAEALDRTLAALADPTRRGMVERLAKGGRMAISDLATPFAMSLPAVLKHVGVLTDAGLVSRVKVGRTVYCHLLSGPVRVALTWLRKYEDYQPPAQSETAREPKVAPRKAQKPTASQAKRPAAKGGRKALTRANERAQTPKSKGARGRTKTATPAGQRSAGRSAAVTRPAKKAPVAKLRRRPGR